MVRNRIISLLLAAVLPLSGCSAIKSLTYKASGGRVSPGTEYESTIPEASQTTVADRLPDATPIDMGRVRTVHDTVTITRTLTRTDTLYRRIRGNVKPGIEVLRERGFAGLVGKRVGLLTNPSGVDRHMNSTVDILFNAPGVQLKAIFAPEHGARGDVEAGGYVSSYTDKRTGLPVYSMYGETRKPTPAMLKGLDIVVYDIQDVGTRSYTFISSLGLMMQACAEQGIDVMVLDRPNPLGGLKVEGPLVEQPFNSFVSQYRIPYVYGLTVGELAGLINEEGLNRGQKGLDAPLKCNLTVIPMEGWERDMLFADTGLQWILPSPNIPFPETAVCYPAAGLCGEFNGYLQIGIGFLPFGVFAAEWIDADVLKSKLDSWHIPGTSFRTIHYSRSGKSLQGVQYFFTDYEAATVTLTQFYVMQAVYELYKKDPFKISPGRIEMFNKVCGTDYVSATFRKSFRVSDITPFWNKDVEAFRKLSKRYYLY